MNGLHQGVKWAREMAIKLCTVAERRRSTRVAATCSVRYHSQRNERVWVTAKVVDFSEHGMRLVTEKPVAILGKTLELDFRPPGAADCFHLRGTVVRVRQGALGTAECGIAFNRFHDVPRRDRLVHYLAEKLCVLAHECGSKVVPRLAKTAPEFQAACRLLYREYLKRGYCHPHPAEMYYSYHILLPDSRTFVTTKGSRILGTVSLICDSLCGLPMEGSFAREIEKLRGYQIRLAEVGLLALSSESIRKGLFSLTNLEKLSVAFSLFKWLFDYAWRVKGVTDLVIAVHPKHESLYRYLNFEPIGQIREYPGARHKPALPMRLCITEVLRKKAKSRAVEDYFLRKSTPLDDLYDSYKLDIRTVEEMLRWRGFSSRTLPLWASSYLRACYPEINFQ